MMLAKWKNYKALLIIWMFLNLVTNHKYKRQTIIKSVLKILLINGQKFITNQWLLRKVQILVTMKKNHHLGKFTQVINLVTDQLKKRSHLLTKSFMKISFHHLTRKLQCKWTFWANSLISDIKSNQFMKPFLKLQLIKNSTILQKWK